MKKILALLIGLGAGAVLTASIASTKRGKELRSNLVKKADELRQVLADDLEKKARLMHDSDVVYT
jgi:gas vesicle protein